MRPKREKTLAGNLCWASCRSAKSSSVTGKKKTQVLVKIKSASEASERVGNFLREPGKSNNNGGERGEEDDGGEIAQGGDREMSH